MAQHSDIPLLSLQMMLVSFLIFFVAFETASKFWLDQPFRNFKFRPRIRIQRPKEPLNTNFQLNPSSRTSHTFWTYFAIFGLHSEGVKRPQITQIIQFYRHFTCCNLVFMHNKILNGEKLNSNPYQYKLKFVLTSKQMYNSKFQEFETIPTVKIQKND